MAWVTMVSKAGSKILVPEPVYNNMYKWNEAYSIFEEPKPTPKLEEKTEVVKDDSKIQRPVNNANRTSGKSTKKTIS